MNDHLKIRAVKKKKKPTFIRQDAHKSMRIERKWRRPKGITNKIRLQKRGYRRRPETGWGSPVDVKYLSQEGKKLNLVATLAEVEKLNPKIDAAIIARTGAKKKLILIAALNKKNITIANIDAVAFEKAWQAKLAAKATLKDEKKKKISDKADKKTEDKKEDDKTGDQDLEEKKKKEKEEKDKLLTKRT